jgi:hypothetical protein
VAFDFAPRRSPGPVGAEPEGGPSFQGKSMDSWGAKRRTTWAPPLAEPDVASMLQASGCVVEHSDRSGWIKYQSVHADHDADARYIRIRRKRKHSLVRHKHLLESRRNKTKTQPQLAHTTNCACPPETCPLPHCRSSRADVCRTVECCNHAHGTVNQSAGWSRWLDAGWAQFGHAGRTPTAHAGLC